MCQLGISERYLADTDNIDNAWSVSNGPASPGIEPGVCGEMGLISLGPIPVKVTIPVKWENPMRDLEGDLSEREKTVSYFGNCKNRRHETAAGVSASRVRRMDYRVRVRGRLGPPHTPRTQQSSRLNIPLPVFPAIIRCRSGLKRV